VLIALPVAAATRATWEFFSERVEREPWPAGAGVPVLEREARAAPRAEPEPEREPEREPEGEPSPPLEPVGGADPPPGAPSAEPPAAAAR
jgi:hypothetical protein